jgi:hypothetical protein
VQPAPSLGEGADQSRVPDRELDIDEELIARPGGRLFTGIAFDTTPDGGVSEVNYVAGVHEGWSRDRTASGAVLGESHYRNGALHGEARDFDRGGRLLKRAVYEFGIPLEVWKAGGDGALDLRYRLSEDEPTYTLVRVFRQEAERNARDIDARGGPGG